MNTRLCIGLLLAALSAAVVVLPGDGAGGSPLTSATQELVLGANNQTTGYNQTNNCAIANGGPSVCASPNQGYFCLICSVESPGYTASAAAGGSPLQNGVPSDCTGVGYAGTCQGYGDPSKGVVCVAPFKPNAACNGKVTIYGGQPVAGPPSPTGPGG